MARIDVDGLEDCEGFFHVGGVAAESALDEFLAFGREPVVPGFSVILGRSPEGGDPAAVL